MFSSLESLEHGQTLKCDVCVMGAGAAGITLALELEHWADDVCVFEGRGFEAPLLKILIPMLVRASDDRTIC